MKKTLILRCLLVLMTLALLLPLCSCEDELEDVKYAYVFYEDNLTLMKVDVYTGKATTVCSDPLCKHASSECPFYRPAGVGNRFTISNNNDTIYYIAEGDGGTYCLRKYSLKTGSVTEYFCSANTIKNMLLVDKILFFTEQLVQYDENNNILISTNIYRLDISNDDNEVEKLTNEPEENTVLPVFMIENKLMWQVYELNKCYTTNLNYTDRQSISDIQKTYAGDYNYKLTSIENSTDVNLYTVDLARINKKTLTTETILRGIRHFRICDDCVLYTRTLSEPELIGNRRIDESLDLEQQTTYYNYVDTKLFSCDLDGTNERVVCDLEAGYYIFSASSAVGYTMYYGDYHLIDLYKYEYNSAGEITNISADAHMVVNIKTGEYHIVAK